MRTALLVLIALLAGCASRTAPRPLPPELIRVPVTTYVPIPSNMTQLCSWVRDAPLSQVIEVAAGRRACLLQYEKQLQAIRGVEGRPAP